jgi:hypothetical protein
MSILDSFLTCLGTMAENFPVHVSLCYLVPSQEHVSDKA